MSAEPIQAWTARLEAVSHACAGAFRAVAPQIIPLLTVDAFEHWAGQGLLVAQTTWRGWECAVWYFKVSPYLLAHLDMAAFGRLTEVMLRVVQFAPQLGSELLRGAARFVEQKRPITLDDWLEVGERLAAKGRSGRVAAAYFEASPEVLPLTAPLEFREWTDVVQTLAQGTEVTAQEFVRQSARRLAAIPPLSRLKALGLLHALARCDPTAALEAFNTLPSALLALSPALRDRLTDAALRLTETAHRHVEPLLKAISRALHGLPEADQDLLLSQCLRLASVDVEAAMMLCDHLPTVLQQLATRDIEAWVARGLAVLRDNRDGGIAYFALESQACQAELAALGRVVYLQPVQGVLRLYASALSGTALSVRPLSELPATLRSGWRQLPTMDGETIYLPASSERFGTRALNFQMLLVMTAHQAGYIEFGTFAFAFDVLLRSLSAAGGAPDVERWRLSPPRQAPAPRSDFERFFALFPHPSLARDIFYSLEDGRIDRRLCYAYRGLAPHIERLIRHGLASRAPMAGQPVWAVVLEMLMHLCSGGELAIQIPPAALPLARFLRHVASGVRQPQATVYDSAKGTLEVYGLLERLPNVPLPAWEDDAVDGEVVSLTESLSKEAALEDFRDAMQVIPMGEEVAYQSPDPLPHQGEFKPELVQRKLKVQELSDELEQLAKTTAPMSPELLRQLLEQGIEIDIRGTVEQEQDETSGLFVSDLEDKGIVPRLEPKSTPPEIDRASVREQLQQELKQLAGAEVVYRYDEWDYLMRDYRVQWCLLREKPVEGEATAFVSDVLQEHAGLIKQIRRQFQMLKPEMFKKLKRRDHGEEIDLDAVIESVVDRRVTGAASERVYIKRDKRDREVSTIFLLDLSASTDDPIEQPVPSPTPTLRRQAPPGPRAGFSGLVRDESFYTPLGALERQKSRVKRIIDIEREALVVMAEALESIGDEYAVYGFSGYGRDNVEFFMVKDVEERYSEVIRRRIDALKPYRSTRMGPAIRHAVQKLYRRPARLKTLVLLSDGYPQDFDYGKDRRGKDYGMQDTKVALQEARRKGIHTFCITVDREGKSYLPEMCGNGQFIVIENVARLPHLLPTIYRGLTT
jgi:nitric oxide reductase NorD protein